MSDPEKLREAIQNVRAFAQTGIACADGRRGPPNGNETWEEILAVCRAAESTLPKTKMVEVWIVHFAVKRHEEGQWAADCMPMTEGEAETRKEAAGMERDPMYAYIRVTGPHQQEIPSE